MISESNIFIIEDDLDLTKLWSYWLKKAGCKPFIANNGEQGLKLFEKTKPDLIILDYMMPLMTGIEFLIKIREKPEYSDIPVLMLTAEGDLDLHVSALHKGVDKYLEKPIKREVFIAEIENSITSYKNREKLISNSLKNLEKRADSALLPLMEAVESSDNIIQELSKIKSDIKFVSESNLDLIESLVLKREIIVILFSTIERYAVLIDEAVDNNDINLLKEARNKMKQDESVADKFTDNISQINELYDTSMAILNQLFENMQFKNIYKQQNNHLVNMMNEFRTVLRNILIQFDIFNK